MFERLKGKKNRGTRVPRSFKCFGLLRLDGVFLLDEEDGDEGEGPRDGEEDDAGDGLRDCGDRLRIPKVEVAADVVADVLDTRANEQDGG